MEGKVYRVVLGSTIEAGSPQEAAEKFLEKVGWGLVGGDDWQFDVTEIRDTHPLFRTWWVNYDGEGGVTVLDAEEQMKLDDDDIKSVNDDLFGKVK